jgi:hypothetical protein
VDPSRAAGDAALAAYRGYLDTSQALDATGDWESPELARYVGEPLLSTVRFYARRHAEHGAMYQGTIGSHPMVREVRLDTRPPTVTLEDCLDYSTYTLVYRSNRSPVPIPSKQPDRLLGTATVTRQGDGRWLVTEAATNPNRTC